VEQRGRDNEGRARHLNWSGLPVVHVRPTVFLDTGLFTTLAARSIADSGTIRLPFGTGRTSPIASDDVARVVATVLTDPGPYIGRVLELTGPRSQDMNGVAAEYAGALSRPISYVDVPWETWAEQVLAHANLGPYVDECSFPAFGGSYRSDELCATAACEPRRYRAFGARAWAATRRPRLAGRTFCAQAASGPRGCRGVATRASVLETR
jgi:uncharacterized protein YbjT (DUF2867 family)